MNGQGTTSWLSTTSALDTDASILGLGAVLTIRAVSDRFFWPGMVSEVGRFCECARSTRPNHHGLLRPISTSAPFELLACDIFGPVPKTRRGNCYVAVFVDHLSKWVELAAAKDISAKHIAKLLQEVIIPRHGCPISFLTD
eukprot:GHVN01048375.1.p1 GENE.GHVN01048375.1~~GHVN01048375.1.p1  ORF type:complete len:141 (-),score=5.26 GHVN01048375.1:3447-3869(-)